MTLNLRLGGHIPSTEGLSFVVAAARGLQYREVQTTLGDPRDYLPAEVPEETARTFRKMAYDLVTTVHLPYVINPCEDAPSRRGYYKHAVKEQRTQLELLGARRAVLHPGFKKSLTEQKAFDNLLRFVDETWPEDLQIELLLETDSGSKNGSAVGTAEFIRTALETLERGNVRMCVDTEHLYARGTNLWDRDVRRQFLEEFGHLISLVHLNVPDPEVKLGSFLDRHNTPFEERTDLAHEGLIEDLAHLPMILERRSLTVQTLDNLYVRRVLGVPLEKTRA